VSSRTLGLDLGSNSIGWALVDEARTSIVAAGVRVLPEGVDRDQQGGEKSKSQTRRDARGARRQTARRARRKRKLRELLATYGLLPSNADDLERVLVANPYQLRFRALDETIQPHEIGRVLLHLNQRRGFLSNRKTDRSRERETKGMLAEMSDLANAIERTGSRTLGEYLARTDADFEHASSSDSDRIRRRHTRRDMYEHEFETIWAVQSGFQPSLLTDELRQQVRRIIFFQRDIYWPRSVVGHCELEPGKRRCPRAHRAAQRFRILQEVNNLRLLDPRTRDERSLTPKERTALIDYLCKAKQRTFDQIRKKLGLAEDVRFNLERGERGKLKGHETDAALGSRGGLGTRWNELPAETRDAIVDVLVNEEREDRAVRRLVEDCDLGQEEGERALGVNLPDGHMNFSREAITRLLPHLERGLLLMADDASNSALHAAGYLRPDERVVAQRDFLPPGPDLPNPIVRQALVEVRKVVNAVIREYGKPDRIHIELARDAKKSFEQRREIRIANAKRRKEREGYAAAIEKLRAKPTRAAVNRYMFWREQDQDCVYCGQKIGLAQLFTDGEVDVDHILPRWRSLDNSLPNQVVCHRKCNAAKGDRTPREWLEELDAERYERVLRVVEKLPYNKRRRFQQKDIVLDYFVERQLRDTAYISRRVTQFLRCLGMPIVCSRGQMTADLRHWWGLDTILDPEGRGEKNRADHRHHTVDAVVIALIDHKRLHALANARGKDVRLPWPALRDDVARAIADINVSHRALRRLSGGLHEDTFYGPTLKPWNTGSDSYRPWAGEWTEGEGAFVRRKPVTEIKNRKHLDKVRDGAIRQILRNHLLAQGIDPDQPGRFPGIAFKGEKTPRMPSGVPIKKVRMIEESETFRPVSERRYFQYVKPGNNHHIVYRAVGKDDDEKWTAEVVTMWEAAVRARTGRAVIDRSDNDRGRFVMSLSIGEMFQIDGDAGRRLLCVVQKMRQDDRRVNYKLHTDARPADEVKKDNLSVSPKKIQECNARKVTVNPLGRIRRAND
jgi:CRISPR-associated endonuclease Csn1